MTYTMLWRNKWLTSNAIDIDEMIDAFKDATAFLEEMKAAGVTLNPDSGIDDDHAELVTEDKEVADKYGFGNEEDFWDDDEWTEDQVVYNDELESDLTTEMTDELLDE